MNIFPYVTVTQISVRTRRRDGDTDAVRDDNGVSRLCGAGRGCVRLPSDDLRAGGGGRDPQPPDHEDCKQVTASRAQDEDQDRRFAHSDRYTR